MSSTKGYTLRGSLGLKLIVVITIFVAIASAAKEKNPERKALYRLEYIDIQKVLDNHRMLTNFIKCFLRQGPCTPEARDFRKLLPKLAVSMCGDCSQRQRNIIKKVFNHLMINRPKEWQMLLDRFDPQRKYAERLHVFMSDNSESLYTTTPIPSKSELLKKIQAITSPPPTTTTSSTTTTTTTTSTAATPTTTITPPTDRPENPTKSPALLNNTGSENSKSDS